MEAATISSRHLLARRRPLRASDRQQPTPLRESGPDRDQASSRETDCAAKRGGQRHTSRAPTRRRCGQHSPASARCPARTPGRIGRATRGRSAPTPGSRAGLRQAAHVRLPRQHICPAPSRRRCLRRSGGRDFDRGVGRDVVQRGPGSPTPVWSKSARWHPSSCSTSTMPSATFPARRRRGK